LIVYELVVFHSLVPSLTLFENQCLYFTG